MTTKVAAYGLFAKKYGPPALIYLARKEAKAF
jgi:hypothetical protein